VAHCSVDRSAGVIDVNRVEAELEMGVMAVIAPERTAREHPVKGVPDRHLHSPR
jgi:hypothetical protein